MNFKKIVDKDSLNNYLYPMKKRTKQTTQVSFTYDDVIRFYEYFYKRKKNEFAYKLPRNEKLEKLINNFISYLEKHYLTSPGQQFLWDYFVYQFNYWRNAELQVLNGKFRIELIIGKKAFLRFVDDSRDDKWVIKHSDIIRLYSLRKTDLIAADRPRYNNSYEVPIKKKFHNTDRGFYICISSTTLFDSKHQPCQTCTFSNECKQLLKDKNESLFHSRTN